MSKREQRQAALEARRSLSVEEREARSAAICERLLRLPEVREAKTVLSYQALPDEVDLRALEAALDCRIAYPRCLGEGLMEARVPTGPMKAGPYGIREPDPDASEGLDPEAVDLVLAPCVAFDAAGHRLGHGAGYYDRYLPRTGARVICVAFEAQRLDRVETETTDRDMDGIVTEKAVYRIR